MSSWLGNSLSSIGGQLTNLTKEVFTEGTEEVTDHATELHISTARVKELEAALVTKLYENGRLQKQVADASERAESAEMQIHGISAQYRTLLENKEKETKDLTDRVHDLEDLNSKAIMSPPNSPGSHHNQNHHGNQYQDDNRMIGHDLVEFADVITSQREINRLSQEVQRLRTECDKWRHQAAHKKGFTAAGVTSVSREELVSKQDELKHLQLHVQELQTQLDEERESSQRQLTALQDAHAIRVSQLKQRQQQQQQQQPTSSSKTTTEDGSQGAEQGARLDDQLRASVVERNKSEEEIRRLRQHLAQISHYIMHAKTLKEVREISSPTPGTTSPDAISLTSTPVQNTIKSRCVEEGGDLSQYYSSVEAPDTSNVTLHNLSQESQEIVEDEYSEEGGYRTRIAELEQASSEWDVEKGALEDLVVKLRRQSKEKDKHIADRMAAQGSQTMAGELAHIQTRLEASLQQVTSLQEQNFELQAKVQRIETERHTVTNDATEQREDAATSHQGTPLSTTTEDSETLAELSGTIASLQGELEALNETSLILAEEKLRYEQQVIEGAEQLARTQRRHRDEHSQSEATINALMAEKQRLEEEREHQVALQRAGEKKVARLQAELSATEGKMAELHAEGATARQEAERLRHENVSLEREAALARQNLVHQRELATDSLQGALRDNERDGREGSPGAAATSAAELADARGRCALLAQEASELDDRLREKAAENVIMEALVAERDRDATRLAATLADAETRGAEAEQERQALTTRLREQRGAAETETRRLDAELARISAVSREAEARLAESVAQNARFRSHLNDDAHQVASVRHELEEQTAQLGALKESNGRQEATLAAQAQQIAETSVANQRLLRDNVARTEETERHRTEIRSLKAAIAAREDGEKSAREERGRGSKEDEKEEGDLGDAEKKGESRTEAEKDSNMESGNDGVRHGDNNCPAPRDDANDRNFVVLNGGNESDWDAGEEGVTGGSPQREGAGGAQPGERHATNVRLREAREQLRSLHAQLSSLQAERGKLLAVLQERTRETASLRAEVHRLVDAVAAAEQRRQQGAPPSAAASDHDDMQREALHNLARLVRDKEEVIEALTLKNEALTTLVQAGDRRRRLASGGGGGGEAALHEEAVALRRERDALLAAVKQKHAESTAYHADIQRLTAALSGERRQRDDLQGAYRTLAARCDDAQRALTDAENRPQQPAATPLDEAAPLDGGAPGDAVVGSLLRAHLHEIGQLKQVLASRERALQEKERWMTEKDRIVRDKTLLVRAAEEATAARDNEVTALKRQLESAGVQMSSLQTEINDVKQKAHDSEERQSDQLSENGMLKETNNRLMMAMQEKDFELKALQEKVATLTELLQQTEGAGSTADNVQQLLAESERMQAQAQTFQHERDQVMLALKQRQVETGQLQSQVRSLSERERKLQAELERLREHLLQVEQSYTEEALQAEGREKDLRNRLAAAETKLTSSSSAAQNVSLQASLQIESLQEQLRVIAEQRDGTAAQLRASQTQAQQHAASLHNLELVLEQFQRDREAALGAEVDKWQQQLADREEDVITLKTQLSAMQNKVLSMEEALDAGQRLSEQVDRNAELITSLRQTVQEKEAEIEELHNHIIRFQTHEEGKVDKLIIKNLFLGYYTTPISKRTEVIRLIASVLNFTQDEIAKATGEGQGSSWLPGFLRRSSPGPQATPPNTPSRSTMARDDADKSSFSQMFIKFLEVESTPKATLRLPAEHMAQELHTKTHNPFISAMSTVPPAGSRAVRQRPPERHLLMKSLNDTLPTFQPVPVDGKMDSAIIKTVLQPQP